jgi:hypothetical protein
MLALVRLADARERSPSLRHAATVARGNGRGHVLRLVAPRPRGRAFASLLAGECMLNVARQRVCIGVGHCSSSSM